MMDLEGRGMKAQMRTANKLQAEKCYILGEEELKNDKIVIKNMKNSEQKELSLSEIIGK